MSIERPGDEEVKRLNRRILELERAWLRDRAVHERKEAISASQTLLLGLIAAETPLGATLDTVARSCEALAPSVRCTIYVREGETLVLTAHPSIPPAFASAASTIRVASDVGSCGAAAFGKVPVLAEDIANDPRWAGFQELAVAAGLRACWSTPLLSAGGEAVGTLSGYLDEARPPTPDERQVLDAVVDLALVAIERENATKELRLMRTAIAHVNDLVILTDAVPVDAPGPRIRFVNHAFLEKTGWTREEVLGRSPRFLQGPKTDRGALARIRGALVRQEPVREVLLNYTKDGREMWLDTDIVPVRGPDGVCTHMVAIERDVTEQRRLEEELRQSQKLEAIAVLSAGIAHDFNNLLSVVLTTATFLRQGLPPGDPLQEDVDHIEEAGNRAAALTRQLLAFGRRQVLQPRVMSLNDAVASMLPMLERVVGESVEIRCRLDQTLGYVYADPGQVEQVLMNLVVNARDAMPAGGVLTIATELTTRRLDTEAGGGTGTLACLSIADTGVGMTPETQRRIFEPFFSTKGHGSGTGLGLSSVFGIVKQSGGEILCSSTLGVGSRMDVLLPQVAAEETVTVAPAPALVEERGTETVLVVDDDADVRRVSGITLRRAGYQVFEAQNPGDALLLAEQHLSIDLVLTDAVMPRMSGTNLATRLRQIVPGLRVVVMSGHAVEGMDPSTPFLAKPIVPASLLRKIREVLDEPMAKNVEREGGTAR